jgi:apolipoprotein N-acyltransferase
MYISGDQMSGTLAGIFFLVAIICWVFAAFGVYRVPADGRTVWGPALVPLGLAFFAVPFCYNAFVA